MYIFIFEEGVKNPASLQLYWSSANSVRRRELHLHQSNLGIAAWLNINTGPQNSGAIYEDAFMIICDMASNSVF